MTNTVPTPLPAAVDGLFDRLAQAETPRSDFEPVEVRVSSQDGAIVVTSDGTRVHVELSDPIRLDAATLSEELNAAVNDALAGAQERALEQLDHAQPPDGAGLAALGRELVDAYRAEMQALDERIAKVAGE